MKFIQSAFSLFIICTLFSSCATVNHMNDKNILGSWTFDDMRNFTNDPSGKDASRQGLQSSAEQPKEASSKDMSAMIEIKKMFADASVANDFSSFFKRYPDLLNTMEFRQDNTATISSKIKTTSGTWKFDKSGTKISLKESGTKKVTKIKIESVDPSFLTIIQPVPEGNLIIQYRRHNKK